MSNEKPIEPRGWRDRLDSLEELPGGPWTGKSASWDRLHARLHEKPGRKKTAWWWAAAAVLLVFVSGALWMIQHNKENTFAKQGGHNTLRGGAPGIIKQLPAHQDTALYVQAPSAESAQVIKNRPLHTNDGPVVHQSAAIPGTMAPLNGRPGISIAIAANAIQARADSPRLVSLAALPKKTLRVVHINELDSPAGEDTPLIRVRGKRLFRIVIPKIDISSSASLEKQEDASDWLKIKIPIQN